MTALTKAVRIKVTQFDWRHSCGLRLRYNYYWRRAWRVGRSYALLRKQKKS